MPATHPPNKEKIWQRPGQVKKLIFFLLCVILITMAGFALYFLDRISVSTRGELLTDDKCHLDVRVRKSITWLAQMNCFLSRAGPLCRAADVYHTAALPQRARSFGFPALRPSERVTLLIQLS